MPLAAVSARLWFCYSLYFTDRQLMKRIFITAIAFINNTALYMDTHYYFIGGSLVIP
jgi:hypothetical protein